MATIGTFTASENGYNGSIKTLTLNIKAKFVTSEKDKDKAPDYRILQAPRSSARPGRRPPATAIANASRSSSTIRAPRADLCIAGQGRGRRRYYADLVPPRRGLMHGRVVGPTSSRAGPFALLAPLPWKRKEHFLSKGLLMAPPSRARVRTKCAGRNGFPGLPRLSINLTALALNGLCRRARTSRALVRRVIPVPITMLLTGYRRLRADSLGVTW